MSENPNRFELIKLFIEDRNLHFSHPAEAYNKFLYTLGATLTPIVITLFFTKTTDLKLFNTEKLNWGFLIFFGSLIFIGILFHFWGLIEHSNFHQHQRKRIESAINYLLETENYDFNQFSKWLRESPENTHAPNNDGFAKALLVAEPDARNWLKFHDRKFDAGNLLMLIGMIGFLITLIISNLK